MPMIPKETVDRVLDATQIEDVIGDFVSLKRRGANYMACCPFHNEKTPSFSVSPSKGIYKCFGCGKSGTAVGFLMEYESLSYTDAIKYLAKKYHIEVVEKEETAEEIARRQKNESLFLVSEYAVKFFSSALSDGEGRSLGLAYLKSRGLEDETIRHFQLGWASSSRTALSEATRAAGYKEEYLIDSGLCYRKNDGRLNDRFYERVMFPVHSPSGRVIAFGGRTLKSDKTVAKYVNSPETEIYVKSRSLYGIYFAKNGITRKDKCILVEGYLDVISMHQLGITNVVASSGTSLTVEQVRLIKKFTTNITIIYDGDSAGIHAALRGISIVLKEGMNVRIVLLPDGDDPDSFCRKHTLEEIESFISGNERDFISFKSDMLMAEAGNDPIRKAEMINDIADTVAMIPDAIKRSVYVGNVGKKFALEQDILFSRIAATRKDMLLADRKQSDRQSQSDRTGGNTVSENEVLHRESHDAGTPGIEDALLAPCERELLGFILEYGREPLAFPEDSEFFSEPQYTVAEFIDASLSEDNASFANTVYRKIYDLYFEMYDNGMTSAQICQRLMSSTDEEVVAVVSDLLIEKYDITVEDYRKSLTSEQTILVKFVPRAVLAYQLKKLDRMLKEQTALLNESPMNGDEVLGILEKVNNLNKARSMINNKLGRI